MCSKVLLIFLFGYGFLVHSAHAAEIPLTCNTQFCEGMIADPLKSALSATPKQKPDELMIFVSLTMPEQSLKAWAQQAAQFDIPLRIRGFYKDSLQKTAQKILELFGENNLIGISIDPASFEQYNIQAVPAVVLAVAPLENSEKTLALFEVVYGDTPLDAALELMTQKGSPEVRTIASRLLNQPRGH